MVPVTQFLLTAGKPHPRWAETNFRDGDPNEKWHSRATKCTPQAKRRGHTPEGVDEHPSHTSRGVLSSLLTPIKTESVSEVNQHQLYRFSPSPGPSIRYHTFQSDGRSPSTSSFENEPRQPYSAGPPSSRGSGLPYHPSSSVSAISYNGHPSSTPSSFHDGGGGGGYAVPGCEEDRVYVGQFTPENSSQSFCPCRTSPATGHTFIALSQQLQSTLSALRQYSQHPPNSQCLLYRRIVELNNLMQYVSYTFRHYIVLILCSEN